VNRRGFLARLFAAPIVALSILKAPVIQEPITPLAFHPDAFAFAMRTVDLTRCDVIYGFATVAPDFAIRCQECP
jgi:hypothetical protein